jgi:hypothetical protein
MERPAPATPDILTELQAAITQIIAELREGHEREGPTAAYFAGVARLGNVIDQFNGFSEALAPRSFKDTF